MLSVKLVSPYCSIAQSFDPCRIPDWNKRRSTSHNLGKYSKRPERITHHLTEFLLHFAEVIHIVWMWIGFYHLVPQETVRFSRLKVYLTIIKYWHLFLVCTSLVFLLLKSWSPPHYFWKKEFFWKKWDEKK